MMSLALRVLYLGAKRVKPKKKSTISLKKKLFAADLGVHKGFQSLTSAYIGSNTLMYVIQNKSSDVKLCGGMA